MYIVVGSITMATRLAKLLDKTADVSARVVHTPSKIGNGGCSYSVRIEEKSLDAARAVIEESGIRVKAIYAEEMNGGEYRDIS
jgi:hypothetical protein